MHKVEGQALLIAVRTDCGHVIAVIGEEAREELDELGWDMGEHDIPHENSCMTEEGLFVWEGYLEYEDEHMLEVTWWGDFRPARVDDLPRFGLQPLDPAPEGDQPSTP